MRRGLVGGILSSGPIERNALRRAEPEGGGELSDRVALGVAAFAALQQPDRVRAQPRALGQRLLCQPSPVAVLAEERAERCLSLRHHGRPPVCWVAGFLAVRQWYDAVAHLSGCLYGSSVVAGGAGRMIVVSSQGCP